LGMRKKSRAAFMQAARLNTQAALKK